MPVRAIAGFARNVGRFSGGSGLGSSERTYGLGLDAAAQYLGVRNSGLVRGAGKGH